MVESYSLSEVGQDDGRSEVEVVQEKLVCDRCTVTYTDEGSIEMAKKGADDWAAMCRSDGVEPRGITPCPLIRCPGELVLQY